MRRASAMTDALLSIIVLGVIAVALAVDTATLIGWLRRTGTVSNRYLAAMRAARRRFQCRSANASGDISLAIHQSLSEWSSAYDSASAASANKPMISKPSAGLPHIKIVLGIRALHLGCLDSSRTYDS